MTTDKSLQIAEALIEQGRLAEARAILAGSQDSPEVRRLVQRIDADLASQAPPPQEPAPPGKPGPEWPSWKDEHRWWRETRNVVNIVAVLVGVMFVAAMLILTESARQDSGVRSVSIRQTATALGPFGASQDSPTVVDAVPPGATAATVTRKIDLDNLEVQIDGLTRQVRYAGISGPASEARCYETALAFGERLVVNKPIKLIREEDDTDVRGMLTGYVFVGDVLVNTFLVRTGYAVPSDVGLTGRYGPDLRSAADEAQRTRAGCYSTGGFGLGLSLPGPTNAAGNH